MQHNLQCMNKIFTFLILIIIISSARSQTILTEDFDYPISENLENIEAWKNTGINSTYDITISGPGLNYPNYIGSGKGNAVQITNSGEGDVAYRSFDSIITRGSVYMSFMFRIDSLPASVTQGYCIGLNPSGPSTNINTRLFIKRLNSNLFQLGTSKFFLSLGIDTFKIKTTYLIVLKYSFIEGDENDISSLYVFSKDIPISEPIAPLCFNSMGSDLTNQGSVYLLNNYAQTGMTGINLKIDGIRVGTSWETSVLSKTSAAIDLKSQEERFQISAFPNPFQSHLKIKYITTGSGHVKLDVLNNSGNLIQTLVDEIQSSGTYNYNWIPGEFSSGMYLIRIQKDNEVQFFKVIKI